MSLPDLTKLRSLVSLGGWIFAALFFMGVFAGYIPSPIGALAQDLAEHRAKTDAIVDVMRKVCIHTATLAKADPIDCLQ